MNKKHQAQQMQKAPVSKMNSGGKGVISWQSPAMKMNVSYLILQL